MKSSYEDIDEGNRILKMKLVDCKRESAGLLNNSSY